jgi:hypothetical protein
MDDDPTAFVHEIERPLRDLRDGCQALLRIADGIAVEREDDAQAVSFVAEAMQQRIVELCRMYERELRARRRALVAAKDAGAKGRQQKLQLVEEPREA